MSHRMEEIEGCKKKNIEAGLEILGSKIRNEI